MTRMALNSMTFPERTSLNAINKMETRNAREQERRKRAAEKSGGKEHDDGRTDGSTTVKNLHLAWKASTDNEADTVVNGNAGIHQFRYTDKNAFKSKELVVNGNANCANGCTEKVICDITGTVVDENAGRDARGNIDELS